MNFLRNGLLAVSLLSTGVAFAGGKNKEPNCEIKGAKKHVKNEKACTKKGGAWMAAAPMGEAVPPANAAPVSPPAGAPKGETPPK